MTNSINQKLAVLRIKWKKHPELRPVIERQARALKYSQTHNLRKQKPASDSFVANVLTELLD
jgi:hypothetical protein